MHVVVLAEFAVASGGAEKVAVESARGLADAGVDVTYIQAIAGPADRLLDHPRITRIELGNADIWQRPRAEAAISGIWDRASARRLRIALDGLAAAPDCIHLHQWTRSLSPSVFPVLLGRNVPVLMTLHDYFLACPNGVYYRFDRAAPCTERPLSAGCFLAPCDGQGRLHKLVRFGRSAALRRAIGGSRLDVVHVCDASVRRIGEFLDDMRLEHHRVDNPVSTVRAEPAEPAQGDCIAYVGRLTREKGADLVAEAAGAAGLRALFIGAGPLEQELRGQPHVEVLGWRSPEAVSAILRKRARALAAPSRWFETGPLTVYEALASGIPVIASNRSGAAEKVADGVTGFVAEPEVDSMAEAFRLIHDDDRVRTLGLAAHERYWSAPMTAQRHAERLIALYRTLADDKRRF